MKEPRLLQLAEAAGLMVEWEDSEERPQRLSAATQRELLARLGYSADSAEAIEASLERLRGPESPAQWPPLITAERGIVTDLPSPLPAGTEFTLSLEQGDLLHDRLDARGRLPPVGVAGYHRLRIADAELTVAVAPARCFTPADAGHDERPRLWGLAVQLYALRRPGDGGIGDTLALERLVRHAAGAGAAALGISPTHAMFSADVSRYSPYSPSSRLFYNALHAAPETRLGAAAVEAAIDRCQAAAAMAQLEADDRIDWPRAANVKLGWMRSLYDDVMHREDDDAAQVRRDLEAFRTSAGRFLEAHCVFEALQQHRMERDWRRWPTELRDPDNPEVIRFATENAHEVGFHAFLQWLAKEGLSRAQAAAKAADMPIGLIADLAVGADAAGSQAWSRQAEMLEGLSIGAPPDTFNVHGQDWGLAPFSPQGLVNSGFAGFIEMLRAGFAHAGGLRIDHVLGLLRLWLVPHGASPPEGGYLRYPLDDLLRLVALESWRHRAIVIGEDLGTVPPGLHDRLAACGILGTRVLWFERDDEDDFLPPSQWSSSAVATTSTHDLPTVAGWWAGRDIEWRSRLGLLGEGQNARSEHAVRRVDRARLARALGLLDGHASADTLDAADLATSKVLDACARQLGLTPSPLALLPVEDALGLEEQANLPGTLDAHPNWRRRWADDCDALLASGEVRQRLAALNAARRASRSDDEGGIPDE
ncbi:4-alpha-glucanotransferase [Billgrantia pellis]|uniref:4-alpha-glucanotransferase n=1 Tax=Billgrantia pellis TaxID=2606936 RepID=A0A7V7KI96_9GAMM|nr:4-alpha-glucanotransferase [Halomonas pellis]KAA0012728.1 4-alpha-glucanotransferase [Halomonas pellis]